MGFGDRLRTERERQQYSLDDVAASTKIGTRMLRALEEEKFAQLPGGIFNKGFVRAYARFLKMDEDQAVADYLEAAGEPPPPSQVADRIEPGPDFRFSHYHADQEDVAGSRLPWKLLAVLLLVALAFYGWKYYKRELSSQQPAEPAQAQPQATAPAASAPTAGNQPPAPALNHDAAPGGATQTTTQGPGGAVQTAPVPAAGSATAGNPPAVKPPLPTPAAAQPETVPPGSFTVSLQATENCWLSIAADGKIVDSVVLPASAVKAVHATRRITVVAGNVGGLAISFNGQPLPVQGSHGQVKTLVFGPTGLLPAAPAPAN